MIGWIIDQYKNYFNTPKMQRTEGQEWIVTILTVVILMALWLMIHYGRIIYKRIVEFIDSRRSNGNEPIEDDTEDWLNRKHNKG
jgi:hypothetical protein